MIHWDCELFNALFLKINQVNKIPSLSNSIDMGPCITKKLIQTLDRPLNRSNRSELWFGLCLS